MTERTSPRRGRRSRAIRWAALLMLLPVVYVLSSGPVLAIACLLRETTGWDGFYGAFFLYYPLAMWLRHESLLMMYIGWWFRLLGTVGPG